MGAISTSFTLKTGHTLQSLDAIIRRLERIQRGVTAVNTTPVSVTTPTSKGVSDPTMNNVAEQTARTNQLLSKILTKMDKTQTLANKTKAALAAQTRQYERQVTLMQRLVTIGVRLWAFLSAIRGVAMALNVAFGAIDKIQSAMNRTNAALYGTTSMSGADYSAYEKGNIELDKMYEAAQRARTSVNDLTAASTKFMMVAPSTFKTDDNAIRFAETLSKSFQIAGASQEEVRSVMLQMSQGLSSGYLQGDELRAIRENAPMAAQAIADYMGTTVGGLKELGAEGEITADVVYNALNGVADDIDKRFNEMPMTLGHVGNIAANYIYNSFRPIADKITKLINSEQFKRIAQDMANVWDKVVFALGMVVDAIGGVVYATDWLLHSNSAFAIFLRAVLLALLIVLGARLAMLAAHYIRLGVIAVATGIKMFFSWLIGFGPVGWVLAALAAVVAGIVVVGHAMGWFGDGTRSIWYEIGNVAGQVVGWIMNMVGLSLVVMLLAFHAWASGMIALWGAIFEAWANILGAIAGVVGDFVAFCIRGFSNILRASGPMGQGLLNAFLGFVNGALKGLNWLIDKLSVLGIELGHVGEIGPITINQGADNLNALGDIVQKNADNAANWGEQVAGMKKRAQYNLDRFKYEGLRDIQKLFVDPAALGDEWGNALEKFFEDFTETVDETFLMPDKPGEASGSDGSGGSGGSGVASDVSDIKALLERMKDLAERSALMKFTSVNVDINMDNDIGATDLDGVITYVNNKVAGAMNNSLAGVAF